jgi:hypothetical protein
MYIVLLAILVHGATAAAAPPRASTPEEEKRFAEGTDALARGDFRAAEDAFRAGHAIAADPAFLVHIGEAQERSGRAAQALESYRRYLREVPDASDRAEVEARISRLAPPAPVPAPGASPPEEQPGSLGQPSPAIPAGPGAAPPAGAPAPPESPEPARAAQAGDALEPTPAPTPAPEDRGPSNLRIAAWITVALAGGLAGVAAFQGASARSKQDDVNQLLRFADERGHPLEFSTVARQYREALEDGQRHDDNARAALAGAGIVAGLAAVLFTIDILRDPRSEASFEGAAASRQPALGLAPTRGGAAVSTGWSF